MDGSSTPKTTDETPSEYLIKRWEIISQFEKEVWDRGMVSPRSILYFMQKVDALDREKLVLNRHKDLVELLKGLDPSDPYWNIE